MTPRARTAGMALITAIFLIVCLAALAAAAVSLSKTQQDTNIKSLLSANVYYGAKAGLEWGIQQAIATGSCAGGSFTLTQGALNGVSVTVTCTTGSTFGSGTSSGNVYYLTSQATTGTLGNVNYAERHLSATVSNIP